MADLEQPPVEPNVRPDLPKSQRYLGDGQVEAATESAAGRLFFSSATLFILTVSLIGIVFTFADQLGDRLLVTAYVTESDSVDFPPLAFADLDLERLQSTPGLLRSISEDEKPIENFATEADFERLMMEVLPKFNRDTLILPIRCHSITTRSDTFLQPKDADPARPESGVALTRLLDAVGSCPANNKLLILDITALVADLDLGVPHQLAADQLRSKFKSGAGTGNMWVLMANDNRQSSGASFECRHSVFSMLVAYCLGGGREADDAGRDDGIVTAGELSRFVESSTVNWSIKNRGRLQRPFHLKSGEDFPVAAVRDFNTLSVWLDESDNGDSEAEDAESTDEEASEQQPADGAEVLADDQSSSSVTTESVLARLLLSWQNRRQLRDSPVPIRRPRHWVLWAKNLQRAERELLAGKPNAADVVITNDVEPLQKDLATVLHDTIRYPWTLAFDDLDEFVAIKQNADDLQTALAEPSPRNLNLVVGSPFAEVALLRRLANVFTAGNAWTESQAVFRAIEIRRLAESSARLTSTDPPISEPWLLPFVKSELEAADRQRISAENSLLLNRLDQARDRFSRARRLYEQSDSRVARISAQIAEIHRVAMDCPTIVKWLISTSPDADNCERAVLLNAVMQGTLRLCQQPESERIAPLLTLVRELRREISNAVHDAMLDSTSEAKLELLQLQFLQPEERLAILESLLTASDCPEFRQSLPAFSRNEAATSDEHQELLQTLFEAMGFANVSIKQQSDHAIGTTLRRILSELRADPLALPVQANTGAWEQYVNHLFRTSFQADLLRETRFQATLTDTLMGRMTAEHLVWQMQRLRQNEAAVAGEYDRPAKQISRSLKHANPSYQEVDDINEAAFVARNSGSTIAPDGKSVAVRYFVSANTDIQNSDRTHLIVDWYAQREQLQVLSLKNLNSGEVATAISKTPSLSGSVADPVSNAEDHWRLRLRIDEIANGQLELEVRVATGGEDVEKLARSILASLTAWVELADSSIWNLPLDLQIQPDKSRAFQIEFSDPNAQPTGSRIELLANEAFPFHISVLSRKEAAHEVQLEIHSGGSKIGWPVTIQPGPQAMDIVPPVDASLTIVDGQFEVRIVDVGEIVSQLACEVGVQNPTTSFAPTVSFDTSTRKLSAKIRRLTSSDADMATTTTLTIEGADIAKGQLESQLGADTAETSIDATLAEDPDVTKVTAAIGVAGVGRMFLYDIDTVTGAVTPEKTSRVQLRTPQTGNVYSLTGEPVLSVNVRADSPATCKVYVGIDRNNNDYLETSERLAGGKFWRGRKVETQLVTNAEAGTLSLQSTVSDLNFAIDSSGVAGRQRLLVQLLAGDQSIVTGSTVYFVNDVPPIKFSSPGINSPVAVGLPLTISLTSDAALFHIIQDVEIGVDRNGNGQWEDDETLVPVEPLGVATLKFDGVNEATGVFQCTDLLQPEVAEAEEAVSNRPPETVLLMARAIRRVGVNEIDDDPSVRTGKIITRPIEFVDASQVPPETGSVSGVVQTADGLGQRNATVYLGDITATTDGEGRFRFPTVPVGTHLLEVVATRRAGDAEVIVEAGQTAEAKIQLRLR